MRLFGWVDRWVDRRMGCELNGVIGVSLSQGMVGEENIEVEGQKGIGR